MARWASAPFRLVWWIIKAILDIILGAAGAVEVLGTVFKALLCSLFVWLGWNHGWTVAAGMDEITLTTALWCSLPLVPFLMGSSSTSKSSS